MFQHLQERRKLHEADPVITNMSAGYLCVCLSYSPKEKKKIIIMFKELMQDLYHIIMRFII